MSKIALCQVADTGPLESLVEMLSSVGYECRLPSNELRGELRRIGCDTVLDPAGLVGSWGYEWPAPMRTMEMQEVDDVDLFVDIKAHRSYSKLIDRWPRLENKVLWYRINGGEPEHVIRGDEDFGDERMPPCPILTPNMWYDTLGPWSHLAYACWPPFRRRLEYYDRWGRPAWHDRTSPICLTHNLAGWGYASLMEPAREMFNVRCYGGGSPDGLIRHEQVPKILSEALCLLHFKSSDAPGYSLYEALSAACPCVVSRRLIWRNRMESLFEPVVTCEVFDRPTHEPLSAEDVASCLEEIGLILLRLRDPEENERIGQEGRLRLLKLMWSSNSVSDVESLRSFMRRHYDL